MQSARNWIQAVRRGYGPLILGVLPILVFISLWLSLESRGTSTKRQIAALRQTITSGASGAGTIPTLKERIELESKLIELEDKIGNEIQDIFIKVVGGLFLLIGAYFTWRQVTIAREGQITDRFTKAIGQLGDEKLAIRLGGIYALERIARDSERDQWPIMEVLSAYVRQNAPWDPKHQHQPLDQVEPPPVDIQAILTALAHLTQSDQSGAEKCLNLRRRGIGIDIRRADLPGVHLEGAILADAHLERANLHDAHLQKADLHRAVLTGADLRRANLTKAALWDAHLEQNGGFRAVLDKAQLQSADLKRANLAGAWLKQTDLTGARLQGANFVGADLTGADLTGAQYDKATKWPQGFDPQAHGAKLE